MGAVRLIGASAHPIPLHIGIQLIPESTAADRRMGFSESDHAFEEAEDILIRCEPIPVQPDGGVIDIVRIVVAALRVHELISSTEHRRAVGEHQQRAEVLNLLLAQCGD